MALWQTTFARCGMYPTRESCWINGVSVNLISHGRGSEMVCAMPNKSATVLYDICQHGEQNDHVVYR